MTAVNVGAGDTVIHPATLLVGPAIAVAVCGVAATVLVSAAVAAGALLTSAHLPSPDEAASLAAVAVLPPLLARLRVHHENRLSTAETLADTAALLDIALSSAGMAAWYWDKDTDEVSWSSEDLPVLMGLPVTGERRTAGDNILGDLRPPELVRVRGQVDAVLAGDDEFLNIEFRRHERWLACRARVERDGLGMPRGMIGVLWDRTEARTLQEQLARTLELSDEAFVAFNSEGKLTYANSLTERLLQQPRSELVGKDVSEVAPEIAAEARRHITTAAAHNRSSEFEAFFKRYDRWVQVRVHPSGSGAVAYLRDITARKHAEEQQLTAKRASDMLLATSPQMFNDLSFPQAVRAACRVACEAFGAKRASMWEVSDDGEHLHVLAQYGSGERLEGMVVPVAAIPDLGETLAVGKPVIDTSLSQPGSEESRLLLDRLGDVQTILRVPIVVGGKPTFFLGVSWDGSFKYSDAVSAVVESFGLQVAIALEQARRQDAQRERYRANAQFQDQLRPLPNVELPSVSVATRYQAGEERLLLGGDFIDVGERTDGSISFIIGDVMGHGPEAAALAITIRGAWKALAHSGVPLNEALRSMNSLLVGPSMNADYRLVTVACGIVSPDRDSMEVIVAGHPPPILSTPDGTAELPARTQWILGLRDNEWEADVFPLPPSWQLLAYTDGLTDAPPAYPGDPFEPEELRDLMARSVKDGTTASDIADRIFMAADERMPQGFADDVALLVVQHERPCCDTCRQVQFRLPCEPLSVPEARERVVETAAAVLSDDRLDVVELLTSELVTNAVKHAQSEFSVVVDVSDSDVRVQVFDYSSDRPKVSSPTDKDCDGRGMLLVEMAADDWGVDDTGYGKVVWFSVSADGSGRHVRCAAVGTMA